MLKEASGAQALDSRIEKIQEVMEEAAKKKETFKGNIESIEGRLNHLGQETEEFKEMQRIEWTRKRLSLLSITNVYALTRKS